MRLIYLGIGTFLAVTFVIMSLGGKKYYSLLEGLSGEDFPLSGIYVVGFSWSSHSILRLRGKIREKLIEQAELLYEGKYAEYYANVVWAQFISFVHLCLTLGFVFAGLLNSVLMAFFGAVVACLFGYYFLNHMKEKLTQRAYECVSELPEVVSTMALLTNAGMMLREAWRIIAESKQGTIYDFMKNSLVDMENGMSEADAIRKLGVFSNSPEVRKFAGALTQSIEHGGSELNNFLMRESAEMWALKKQLMFQKGEAASTKLLAPTALLFVGIIIAVVVGAIGMLI